MILILHEKRRISNCKITASNMYPNMAIMIASFTLFLAVSVISAEKMTLREPSPSPGRVYIRSKNPIPSDAKNAKKGVNIKLSPADYKAFTGFKNDIPINGLWESIDAILGNMQKVTKGQSDKQHHPRRRVRKSIRLLRAFEPIPTEEPPVIAHQNYRTFCDEESGLCPPGVNATEKEKEEFLADFDHGRSEAEQLKYDKDSISELLEEVKYYVTRNETLTPYEKVDAALDVDKISYLLHDVVDIAKKQFPNSEDEEETKIFTTLPSDSTEIFPTAMTPSPDLVEQQIAQNMMNDSNGLDVSIVGNSAKETGNQMGKIPGEIHEIQITPITASGSPSLLDVEGIISESTKMEENTDTAQPQSSEISTQSNAENNSSEAISSSVNSSSETVLNPLDIDVENIDLSSLLYTDETNDIARVNEEHEKHKEKMLELIRTLKITGQTEEDSRRVAEMEAQVNAIEEEHQKLLNLKLQYRDNFPNRRGHGRRQHHGQRGHPHHFHHQRPIEPYSTNDLQEQGGSLHVQVGGGENPGGEQDSSNDWRIEIKGQPQPQSETNEKTEDNQDMVVPEGASDSGPRSDSPEVNFNGGFDEKIDKLKRKYPEGYWPKEVDSLVGSPKIAKKVQNVVDQNPELRPRPLPINFIYKDYEELEDGETRQGQELLSNNRVEITKRDLQKTSYNSDEDKLSPENLEQIIKAERISNAVNNSPKRDHHIQEHDAKAKLQRIRILRN